MGALREVAPAGPAACRPLSERGRRPRVRAMAGSSPLPLSSQASRAHKSLELISEFTPEEFDPLGWLRSLAPDSSFS